MPANNRLVVFPWTSGDTFIIREGLSLKFDSGLLVKRLLLALDGDVLRSEWWQGQQVLQSLFEPIVGGMLTI